MAHGLTQDITKIPITYLILGWYSNQKAIINFFQNARRSIDLITDAKAPKITSGLDWLKKIFYETHKRGVRVRLITEITKDNVDDCKDRMAVASEVRHLRDIQFVFGVSDLDYMALVPSAERDKGHFQFMYSESESVIEIKHLIYDALYARSIPAQLRINQLETNEKIAATTNNQTIDRIYSCITCGATFIYPHEIEEHKITTGHDRFKEYPIV